MLNVALPGETSMPVSVEFTVTEPLLVTRRGVEAARRYRAAARRQRPAEHRLRREHVTELVETGCGELLRSTEVQRRAARADRDRRERLVDDHGRGASDRARAVADRDEQV